MSYHLPQYPTNRLETLLHLDTLARTMIAQQDASYRQHHYVGAIVPCDHILHTGSMTMTTLYMLTSTHPDQTHYTIIYDQQQFDNLDTTTLQDNILITSFGHHITIHDATTIPSRIDELCCMLQLYTTVTDLTIISDLEDLGSVSLISTTPIIWVGSTLRSGQSMDESLKQDEITLTQLALGTINDITLTSYHLLSTMREHYNHQSSTHSLIPVSYHNTALIDGQQDYTTSYAAAVII